MNEGLQDTRYIISGSEAIVKIYYYYTTTLKNKPISTKIENDWEKVPGLNILLLRQFLPNYVCATTQDLCNNNNKSFISDNSPYGYKKHI